MFQDFLASANCCVSELLHFCEIEYSTLFQIPKNATYDKKLQYAQQQRKGAIF